MNPNSALLWLPKIEAAGLPTPKTIIVPYSHSDCVSIFDGEGSAEFLRLSHAVDAAANEIGYPVFIRTDLGSAKHAGPRAFRIDEPGENSAIFETLEDSEMKFWMERDGPQAFLVREWLDLESPFTAFRGLKISREWRYFADGDKVICSHPYWPTEALEDHVDETAWPDWQFDLGLLHSPTGDEPELERMAVEAASACGGDRWSVDFCRDVNGKIWLTDMAVMEDSYHWSGCPNGTEAVPILLVSEVQKNMIFIPKPINKTTQVTPAVGQIWQDNDKRSGDRFIKIIAIGDVDSTHVQCRRVERTSKGWADLPRVTWVSVSRLRPTSNGYRFVEDSK